MPKRHKIIRLPKKIRGFTIIELMIVLAIAGLIMVIIFIAVPQLRRHVRNYQRKNTTDIVFAALEQYVGNHGGVFPNDTPAWHNFYDGYIKGLVDDRDPLTGVSIFGPPPPDVSHTPADIDPDYCLLVSSVGQPCGNLNSCTGSDESYTIPCVGNEPARGYARIVFNAKCNGEQLVSANGIGSNDTISTQFAMVTGLESNGITYCIDNH